MRKNTQYGSGRGLIAISFSQLIEKSKVGGEVLGFFGESTRAERAHICEIDLYTGQLVAADPLVLPIADTPFFDKLLPGPYSVDAIIGRRPDGDRRIGLLTVTRPDTASQDWRIASRIVTSSNNQASISADGFFVESGHACVLARENTNLANAMLATETGRAELRRLMHESYAVPTYSYFQFALDRQGRKNMAVFSTGDGDGQYQSYVGLNSAGQVNSLVVDFLVFASSNRSGD